MEIVEKVEHTSLHSLPSIKKSLEQVGLLAEKLKKHIISFIKACDLKSVKPNAYYCGYIHKYAKLVSYVNDSDMLKQAAELIAVELSDDSLSIIDDNYRSNFVQYVIPTLKKSFYKQKKKV